jgi:hypothetical protein
MTAGDGQFETDSGEALLVVWEDCESSLILPNLLAAGGDPQKVHLLRGVSSDIGTDDAWHPHQLGLIREFLEKHPDVRVIVVDVLASLSALGGRNSDRGEDVRVLLDPMHKLGQELGVGVVVLHHQNKRTGESALTRVSGSIQISGTSRLVWAVGVDPDDPDVRRVALVKGNIPGRCEHGFAFKEVATDRGQTEAWAKTCGVNLPPELEDDVFRRLEIVTGLSPITANDLAKGATQQGKELASAKAEAWLRTFLKEHGETADQTLKDAAKRDGIGERALWAAKVSMRNAGHLRSPKRGGATWHIPTVPDGQTFEDVFGD